MRTFVVAVAAVVAVALLVGAGAPTRQTAAQTLPPVSLCEHILFTGVCEEFTASDPDLTDNTIGSDRASSFRAEGQAVAVYEHANYEGRCQVLAGEVPILWGTDIGNDTISSLRIGPNITCNVPVPPAPAQLCEHTEYGGLCEEFTADDPDLSDNAIGTDTASSLRVGTNRVALFTEPNYAGACLEFTADNPGLWDTALGNDTVSSLRIGIAAICPDPPAPAPIQLCEHTDYGGLCEGITADDPDLSENPIGNDRLSSLRIASGQTAAIYEHTNYTGACLALTADTPMLFGMAVGNDVASSVRIGEDAVCAPGPNQPPVAVDDFASTTEGTSITIPVQDNDSDPEGDPFIVVGVTQGAHGTVTQSSRDGTPIYTPAAGFTGTDTFTYSLNGGSTATVTVAVRPAGRVEVCEHTEYGGLCEVLTADDPNLFDNPIGNDRISSVRILDFPGRTPAFSVALFEHTEYGGACVAIRDNTPMLFGAPVGNDMASSLRIGWDC